MHSPFLPAYGRCEGPLGFPMPDAVARAVDSLLKDLPRGKEFEYRYCVAGKAPTELNPGERSDVSWITTESVDRAGEVVRAAGMDDAQFRANPLVTLGHAYWLPPVGRSLWRKRVRDGSLAGVKAKTRYPERPDAWPEADPWPPDKVFALVQAGLLQGKSIGFLPTKVHAPTAEECDRHGWGDRVGLVIDEWLLLEYACVFLPANQDSLVEAVSKGAVELSPELRRALGLDPSLFAAPARPVPFTPLAEVERHAERAVAALDLDAWTEKTLEDIWKRLSGRV
jgi:hypothetical protein